MCRKATSLLSRVTRSGRLRLLGNRALQQKDVIGANAQIPLMIRFSGLDSTATELVRFDMGGNDGAAVTLRYSQILARLSGD